MFWSSVRSYAFIIRLGIIEIKPQNITNETMTFKAPKSPLPGTAAFSVSLNSQ
jgi:hypothetical protein